MPLLRIYCIQIKLFVHLPPGKLRLPSGPAVRDLLSAGRPRLGILSRNSGIGLLNGTCPRQAVPPLSGLFAALSVYRAASKRLGSHLLHRPSTFVYRLSPMRLRRPLSLQRMNGPGFLLPRILECDFGGGLVLDEMMILPPAPDPVSQVMGQRGQ